MKGVLSMKYYFEIFCYEGSITYSLGFVSSESNFENYVSKLQDYYGFDDYFLSRKDIME